MPITKTMAYKVGETVHASLEEAQIAEIKSVLDGAEGANVMGKEAICKIILDNADAFIAILTADPENEKAARKPRSDKGKKRAASDAAINRALQDGKQ